MSKHYPEVQRFIAAMQNFIILREEMLQVARNGTPAQMEAMTRRVGPMTDELREAKQAFILAMQAGALSDLVGTEAELQALERKVALLLAGKAADNE